MMRENVLKILVLAIGIALVVSILITTQSPNHNSLVVTPTGSDTEFILAAKFPELNSKYPVYKTVQPIVSKEYINGIARIFDLEGEVSEMTHNSLQVIDTRKTPEEHIEVFENSGGYRYSIPDRKFRTVDYQPELPSFDEAKYIADKYLNSKHLMPENADFMNVSVCYCQSEWIAGRSDPLITYDILLCVPYAQKIAGLPTIGGTLTVYIGEKGEIAGVTNKMRVVEKDPVRYTEIISPQHAFEKFSMGNYVIKPLDEIYNKITIQDISLAYWIAPLADRQEYVSPVYVFSGTAEGDGETYPIVRYVWANASSWE